MSSLLGRQGSGCPTQNTHKNEIYSQLTATSVGIRPETDAEAPYLPSSPPFLVSTFPYCLRLLPSLPFLCSPPPLPVSWLDGFLIRRAAPGVITLSSPDNQFTDKQRINFTLRCTHWDAGQPTPYYMYTRDRNARSNSFSSNSSCLQQSITAPAGCHLHPILSSPSLLPLCPPSLSTARLLPTVYTIITD
jgi:hypothetical protein